MWQEENPPRADPEPCSTDLGRSCPPPAKLSPLLAQMSGAGGAAKPSWLLWGGNYCPKCPAATALLQLLCSSCPAPSALLQLPCSSCPAATALLQLPCFSSPAPPALLQVPCSNCCHPQTQGRRFEPALCHAEGAGTSPGWHPTPPGAPGLMVPFLPTWASFPLPQSCSHHSSFLQICVLFEQIPPKLQRDPSASIWPGTTLPCCTSVWSDSWHSCLEPLGALLPG